MKQNKSFKLSYLSTLLMLNIGVNSHVMARQDANTVEDKKEDTEVIVVSGIRSSLIKSKDIKMSANNVVDAITAEDIGKFPDQNVAESLQRITGVSIDRVGGEGQLITVRGMGPEFNSVLFNGRTLATTSGGRSFSFDILASELISGAEVHKTQSAKLQEGAIGATVNVTSLNPFDVPGFQAIGSVKALYDDMTGTTKPQFSGLVSNTFDDDKFGVLLSFSHSARESRSDQANTASYRKRVLPFGDLGTVYLPRNYDQIAQTEERDRTGGNLVLQYKPNDDITVSADALYSKYNLKYRQDILAHWFTPENVSDITVDENNTVTKLTVIDGASDTLVRQSDESNELKAFGFNVDWDVNDSLNIVADISRSDAESDPKKGYSDTVAGRPGAYTYDRTSGDLVPTMVFEPFKSDDILYAGWANLQGTKITDEVLEAKVDAKYTLDAGPLVEIAFGALYSDRTLGKTWAETAYPLPWIFGDNSNRIVLPPSLFTPYDSDGFLSGGSGNPAQTWPTFNSDELFSFLLTDEVLNQLDDPQSIRDLISENDGYSIVDSPSAYKVNEELKAIYTDLHFEGELGAMPWAVTTGLRYVETTSTSKGKQVELLELMISNDDPTEVIALKSEDYRQVEVGRTYRDLLPSLNSKIEITEELIARFAYSKSITRPELDEMSPLSSYSGGKIDDLSGSGSNPLLNPFESKNVDLSLEWYYDEGSYAAIAAFKKDVDGYVGSSEFTETVVVPSGTYQYNMYRPANQDSTTIDGYEIAVQHMFTRLPAPFDGLGVIANMTLVDSESTADAAGQKLPLIGLGDSQNLILFYEKDALQFRVAYNNRDRFMQNKPVEGRTDAHYVDDYHQIDVSASYDVNESITLVFEGINVTNELYIKNAEYKNQTLEVTETGSRYSVGVRAKF